MARNLIIAAFLTATCGGVGRAQGLENIQRALGAGFSEARQVGAAILPGKDELTRFLQEHVHVVPSDGAANPATPLAPAAQLDLARLLNRQWKTAVSYLMGGKTVFIGGAFDRQQNAFVSAYVDGWQQPVFFNIRGLLDKEGTLSVGGASYNVNLSANVLHPMKSQIVFENNADSNEQKRISVKLLLDSLSAAGDTVKFTDQSYQAFYYNDVKDGPNGPAVDPNLRTIAMILTEGEDIHVFLVPAESVPSNQVGVFKMHNNKRVGLQRVGNTLSVFENP